VILLPPLIWLIVWAILSVVVCALLGLPPGTKMLETALATFIVGVILLPLAGWLAVKFARRARED
jgi:cation transporter-like permease